MSEGKGEEKKVEHRLDGCCFAIKHGRFGKGGGRGKMGGLDLYAMEGQRH